MKTISIIVSLLLGITSLFSQYKDNTGRYESPNPRNLNIIYFVPTDLEVIPGYERRVSDYMLDIQAFYKENIERWGYPHSTMGLFVDDNDLVKIIVYHGKGSTKRYEYDEDDSKGNNVFLENELKEYFAKHPQEKDSDHTLVIFPGEHGGWPAPFYGGNGICYAVDFDDEIVQNLGKPGAAGEGAQWIGGLAHELGHGLNIQHDTTPATEREEYGESLMDRGNYTYGKDPTYLTHASAAVLNTCQIFQPKVLPDQYEAPTTLQMKNIEAKYDGDENIYVAANVNTNKKVSNVIVYLNPDGDDDYDRVGFVTSLDENNNFEVNCPLSALNTVEGKYTLEIEVVYVDGYIAQGLFSQEFSFRNDIPKLNYSTKLFDFLYE